MCKNQEPETQGLCEEEQTEHSGHQLGGRGQKGGLELGQERPWVSPQSYRQWGVIEGLQRRSDSITVLIKREIQRGETKGRKTLCDPRVPHGEPDPGWAEVWGGGQTGQIFTGHIYLIPEGT